MLLRATFIDTNGRAKLGHAYAQSSFMKKDSYAPESLLGDEAAIGARTDVYGAGVMLWEAITGQELFGIDAPEAIVKKQLGGRIAKALPPAREKWAGALLPVVDRALAVNPNDRYASIAEMAAALRIAVRARLMTHEDVVEEIWPAATTPKVQSGVQPAADPIVADATFEQAPIVVAPPSAPIAVSVDHAVAEVRVPVVAPPHRTRVALLGASIAAAVIVACVVASIVHVRAPRTATLHRDAAMLDDPASAPAVAPPEIANRADRDPERDEDVKPVQAPAAATEVKPKKEIRKPKTKSRFYDPSTI